MLALLALCFHEKILQRNQLPAKPNYDRCKTLVGLMVCTRNSTASVKVTVSMVTDTLMDKLGCTTIFSVKVSVNKD